MALGNKTLNDLLDPISKQLGHAGVADSVDLPTWEFKPQRLTDGLSHDQLVDMFVAEAAKIRVTTHRCAQADLVRCLGDIVAEGVPGTGEPCGVVCADDTRFSEAGLANALKRRKRVESVHVWDEALGSGNVDKALVATYGITYATAGIAETATVVQPTNPKCGRAVSLLPLVHIAVVDASTIQPTMLEVMRGLEQGAGLPSQVCFISGPSATADIELVRVEGVHGPMYVHYVIVE